MDPELALARLRDPQDPALAELAGLLADHLAARTARDVVAPLRLAGHLAAAVRAAAASPDAAVRLRQRIEAERTRWRAERRTPRAWLLPEADAALRDVLRQPWVPSEDLVYRLANQDAVRALVSDVLAGALTRFGQRLRSLDQGLLGGLGGSVAKRGKGLLGFAKELGAAADGLVGGLRDEVEAAFERRVREHVGHATDEAVRAIAAWIASPDHAEALASLRLSVLDQVLDSPVGDAVAELDEVDLDAVVEAALRGLRAAAARPTLENDLAARVEEALGLADGAMLGALLDDLGVRDAWRAAVVDLGADELRALTRTEAFGAWWSALFR